VEAEFIIEELLHGEIEFDEVDAAKRCPERTISLKR